MSTQSQENQPKQYLTDEEVARLDEIVKTDPTKAVMLINAAESGDVVALEYFMRSQHGAIGVEGISFDESGNITAESSFTRPPKLL